MAKYTDYRAVPSRPSLIPAAYGVHGCDSDQPHCGDFTLSNPSLQKVKLRQSATPKSTFKLMIEKIRALFFTPIHKVAVADSANSVNTERPQLRNLSNSKDMQTAQKERIQRPSHTRSIEEPINQSLIAATTTIATRVEEELYIENSEYKQKRGSVACGMASALNSAEYAYKNSLFNLQEKLRTFKQQTENNQDINHYATCIDFLELNINHLMQKDAIFYAGNQKVEEDLLILQSLLAAMRQNIMQRQELLNLQYAQNPRHKNKLTQITERLIQKNAQFNQYKEDIEKSVNYLMHKTSIFLAADTPYFNSNDLVFSLTRHIANDDEEVKESVIDIAQAIKGEAGRDGHTRLPEGVISIIQSRNPMQNGAQSPFDYIMHYGITTDAKGNECIDFTSTSYQSYLAKLNILTFMIEQHQFHPNDFEFQKALVDFLNQPEHAKAVAALASELPDGQNLSLQNIAHQAIEFFQRVKDYGISLRSSQHYTAIVYDARTQTFKQIDSIDRQQDHSHKKIQQEDNQSKQQAVLELLQTAKNKYLWAFNVNKRNDGDIFIQSLESDYDIYQQHGLI